MSIYSRTGKVLLADYHRLAEFMWDSLSCLERAEAHRHAAAEFLAAATVEIFSNTARETMQTAKSLEKSVAIKALAEFKRLCLINRVDVDFSHKDGEFMGTRPLMVLAKFTPMGCHA